MNEAVDSAAQRRERAGERLQEVADKASQFSDAVRETLDVGRAATLRRASGSPVVTATATAADIASKAREELGDVTADELPIKGYDSLAAPTP